jgi:VanZ family protein
LVTHDQGQFEVPALERTDRRSILSESKTATSGLRVGGHLGIILLVIATVLVAMTALLVPIPFKGRVAHAVGNMAHAPLFGGLTLGLLRLLDRFRPSGPHGWSFAVRLALVFVGLFAFGVVIELLQHRLGRTAAMNDVIANASGILAATLWHWSRKLDRYRPEQRWFSRALLASAGFVLALAWSTPVETLRDVAAMHRKFPVLASFESRVELQRWHFNRCQAKLTRQDATSGNYAMEISYQSGSHPAATMTSLASDWSAMKTLELDAVLDASYSGKSVQFMVKVVDQLHVNGHTDAYRGQWTLEPGQPQRIRIMRDEIVNGPDTRALDLSKIHFVHLVLMESSETTRLRVDRIRLTLQ